MKDKTVTQEKMDKLAELLYPYWKDIENPDEHINKLRNNETVKNKVIRSETIAKTKAGKVVKNTFTNGQNMGDYVYIYLDSNGNYVETISNRDTARLNEVLKMLNNETI